jgi:hypothetical protein
MKFLMFRKSNLVRSWQEVIALASFSNGMFSEFPRGLATPQERARRKRRKSKPCLHNIGLNLEAIHMMHRCATCRKPGRAQSGSHPVLGAARKNHARSGDSYTSGLLAVTATSPLNVHGLGSLASPTPGYKSLFGNFRKIRARCSERLRVAVIPHLRNLAERGSTPRE